MNTGLFALRDQHQTLQINTIWILARCTESGNYTVTMTPPLPEPPPPGANTLTLAAVKEYGGLHFTQKDVAALGIEIAPTNPPVTWQMKMTRPGGGDLHNSEVEDALLVLGYDWK
jgi:hypothetical protein